MTLPSSLYKLVIPKNLISGNKNHDLQLSSIVQVRNLTGLYLANFMTKQFPIFEINIYGPNGQW